MERKGIGTIETYETIAAPTLGCIASSSCLWRFTLSIAVNNVLV